jgi:hypothetical protein
MIFVKNLSRDSEIVKFSYALIIIPSPHFSRVFTPLIPVSTVKCIKILVTIWNICFNIIQVWYGNQKIEASKMFCHYGIDLPLKNLCYFMATALFDMDSCIISVIDQARTA